LRKIKVISVLKNRARLIKDKEMVDGSSKCWVLKQPAKNTSDNDEKVRGEWITLP
jgi:hypothetical protein